MRAAPGVAQHGEALDAECVGQFHYVIRPVKNRAATLEVGESMPRMIHCDDAGVQLLGAAIVMEAGPFNPRTGMSVEVEDRLAPRSAVFVISKCTAVLQGDGLIGSVSQCVLLACMERMAKRKRLSIEIRELTGELPGRVMDR